ncbi:hypothetical protein [Streptomyces cinnamoneus]|uniref:hypothetical protein n=1 Tax=Streptomyces cinnamoneus TaxID=53446 RepID=UPI0037A294CC
MPETIRWTVLPDGPAADGRLRLTVLVSPRLTGGTTLRSFPGFLDWPATLRRYTPELRVEFRAPGPGGPGAQVPVSPRQDRYPPASSALWTQLFRADSTVRDPTGAPTAAATGPLTLRSYPGRAVSERVAALYETAATATARRRAFPDGGSGQGAAAPPPATWDHPHLDELLGLLTEDVRTLGRTVTGSYTTLDGIITQGTGGRAADAAENPYRPRHMVRSRQEYRDHSPVLNFAEAYRFYDRPATPAPPPVPQPDLDFHTACALLADYPELLRRFGLALDVLLDPPPGLADQWQARVVFTAAQQPLNEDAKLRPWTAVRFASGQRFEPYAADDAPHGRRMLRLGGPGVHVTDLDVDGAALSYVEFSRILDQTVRSLSDPALSGAPDGTAPPALHGAGFTVLLDDRDTALADRMEDDARHSAGVGPAGEPADAAVLDADHLVRGYRVDVGTVDTATGAVTAWHPLCARTGSHAVRRPGEPPVPLAVRPDEGHVKATAVTHDRTDSQQLYAHPALFGWHGWSLAAPPPGRTLGRGDRPQVPDPEVSPHFPLATAFRPVPGSLPALRYGRTYRLRARLCDLAGNGPDADAATPEGTAGPPVTYGRWEPVPPPVIVPRWPFLEGESETRLVIRSTVDDEGHPLSAGAWALQRNPQVPDHEADSPVDRLDRRYRGHDERHVSPPKTSLQMAEHHGMYDDALGPDRPDAVRRRFFAAASREAGSYLDTKVSPPQDPGVTFDLKALGRIHVAKHDVHDTVPLTELPVSRGSGLERGEYVVHDASQLLLPYLPDVLARGVSLRGLPGGAPNETYDFPGPWPEAKPLRLKIVEGDGPPFWSSLLERELTVRLPKATVATVRMSCRVDPEDLPLLRAWGLLTGSALWNDPVTGLPQAKKDELTAAAVDGENWMITPWTELTLVHAVEKPLEEPRLGTLAFPREAGATFTPFTGTVRSHAASSGRVDVDATWSERTDDPTEDGPQVVERHDRVGGLVLNPRDDTHSLFGLRHEFRDTRHRNVTYTPVATTRFREYFHPAITDRADLITRTGPASAGPSGRGWPVPSSRRPEPPVVSHMVPTVRWERSVDHSRHQVTRTRRHAGFRIHLRRPWFSSGDDELLAVLLDPGTDLPDELVSRCAADPVWADPTPLPRLTPAHFTNAAHVETGRVLAEAVRGQEASVSVAAFEPGYDPERRLWFCDVDIDLTAGQPTAGQAYFPYLRLALARYQPYSVDPLHLSKAVTSDFLQLLPDRTVTARTTGSGAIHLELGGPHSLNALGTRVGTGQAAVAAGRRVLAAVEQRPVGGGDLDWADAGPTVELGCTAAGPGFVWTADLVPPAPRLLPLSEYRLRVEEHERYATDDATADGTVTAGGTAVPVGHRLIHADHFPLVVSPLGRIILLE